MTAAGDTRNRAEVLPRLTGEFSRRWEYCVDIVFSLVGGLLRRDASGGTRGQAVGQLLP